MKKKKDHVRDYAVAAFRYYARIGKTSEEVKEEIGNKIIEERKERQLSTGTTGSPTEYAIMKKEQVINELKAEIDDIDAVDKTLALLKQEHSTNTIRAIEIVYFAEPDRDLMKSEIDARVIKASLELHCGEATIYRMLKNARIIFAKERGLRSI